MTVGWMQRLVLCGVSGLIPAASLATTVAVDLRVRGGIEGQSVAVTVRAVAQGPHDDQNPGENRHSLEAPGHDEIDLEAGVWKLIVEDDEHWAPDSVLIVGEQPSATILTLFRTGMLRGGLELPRGESMPEKLMVRLRSAPDARVEVPQCDFTCPVESDGSWRCRLPAGRLDLALRARSFITHYYWGETLPTGGTRELGTLVLKAGASISGWVEAPTESFEFNDVSVELGPRRPETFHDAADRSRRDARLSTTTPNSRGFFHFAGVEVGSYVVHVRHPGYAVTTISPVDVLERAESEIRKVELALPVELAVLLEPPMDPYGGSWNVGLSKSADVPGSSEDVGQKPVDPEGTVRFGGLEPGSYSVVVKDSRDSSWIYRDLKLSHGTERLELELPFVEVLGEIVLGEEPVSATMWFGGRRYARSIVMKSDGEGLFTGFLPFREVWSDEPQTGWRVDVAARRAGIETWLTDVEVRDRDGDGRVELRLELPDTRLEGEVVDRNGDPVPKARVIASLGKGFRAVTDEGGRFALRALPEGTYAVSASFERQYAEMVTVEVAGGETARAKLVLRESRDLEGLVVGPSAEGIPGAKVLGILDQSTQRWTSYQLDAVTDAGGQFRLTLPDAAERVLLMIFPFGFTATQTWIQSREMEELIIPVETEGGRLLVRPEGSPIPQDQLRIFRDGNTMGNPFVLTWWAEANGEESPTADGVWVFPRLPVGDYTVCVGPPGESWYTGRLSRSMTRCASGFLSAYSELELTVRGPVPPP